MLLSQRLIDYAEPPHSLVRLFELNLDDLEEQEIGQFRMLNGALFSSDGYWLLSGPGLPGADGGHDRRVADPERIRWPALRAKRRW